MIKLNCPSCGGQLDLPNNLNIAFCTFCGTKVVLNTTEAAGEQQRLGRYCELRDIAAKANNYKEVIEYCNRILEIDPSNVDSWIAKAVAVCGFSTEANDGWQEALEYLRTAKRLATNDERIPKIFNELSQKQAKWYLELSTEKLHHAHSLLIQGLDARQDTIHAMEYTLKCLKCAPDNYQYLETLEPMIRAGSALNVQWGEEVRFWLQVLANMRTKKIAEGNLVNLRNQLRQQTANLEKYKTSNNIFAASKIKSTEETILKIRSQITRCEQAVRYEPPRIQL